MMARNQEDEKMFGKFYFAAACLLVLAACVNSDGKTENSPQSKISLSRVFPKLEFSQPILMLQKPAGNDWYVLEQSGAIYRVDTGTQQRNLLLDLDQFYDISSCGECGLLGMAFHPEFS